MSRQKGKIFGSVFTTILILSVFIGLIGIVPSAKALGATVVDTWTMGPLPHSFSNPHDVAVVSGDPNVAYIVSDSGNNRVLGFGSDNEFVWSYTSVNSVEGIAVSDNTVYVSILNTPYVGSIIQLDAGTGGLVVGPISTDFWPFDVAVDSSTGRIYATDPQNSRIMRWDPFEASWVTFLTMAAGLRPRDIAIPTGGGYMYVACQNDPGSAFRITIADASLLAFSTPGFSNPVGIDVDSGNVYVADSGNDRIQCFDTSGAYIGSFGSFGANPGQFNAPYGVASGSGKIYVAEFLGSRIQVFNSVASTELNLGYPNIYYPNQPVSISGYVYPAATYNLQITVHHPDGASETFGPITTGTSGAFAVTPSPTFTKLGSYSVEVFEILGINSPFLLTTGVFQIVTPTIVLNPSVGAVGAAITVTGSHFAVSSTATIMYDLVPVNTIVVSSSGDFVTTFTVPSSAAGSHTVRATDASGNTATAMFTVGEILGTYDSGFSDFARSLVQTSDDGYALAGTTDSSSLNNDFYLVKTDAAGNELWTQTYDRGNYEYAESVVETAGGGFILAGYTAFPSSGTMAWIVKTDASGVKVWDETFGGSNKERANSIIQTEDGFVFAGTGSPDGVAQTGWLVKINDDGSQVLWDYTYAGTYKFNSLVKTSDGGYAIAGTTGAGDFLLIKTDTDGNEMWRNTYSSGDASGVKETSDGGLILAGVRLDVGDYDAKLVRTDSEGNQVWNRIYGVPTLDEAASAVVQAVDGGFVFAGSTDLRVGDMGDAWLVKVDSDGNEVWSQTYGGPNQDQAFDLVRTKDYCYAYTGAYWRDTFLVKTAPDLQPGLYVQCTVDDARFVKGQWNYEVTYPDGTEESYTVPAGGGVFSLIPITQLGAYSIAQTSKIIYSPTATIDGANVPTTEGINSVSVTTDNLDDTDTVSVVFNNVWIGATFAKPAPTEGASSQNSGSTYNMPSRVAVPVQVSWNPDIAPNTELDIIKDKPVRIMVNLADLLTTSNPLNRILGTGESVKIDLACAPAGFFTSYSVQRTQPAIAADNIYIFNVPTPNNVGHYTITCITTLIHADGTTEPITALTTLVKVRETSPLSLYYTHLSLANYGTEPAGSSGDAFNLMVDTSNFVKAVYPVPEVKVLSDTAGVAGQTRQDTPSQYYGMYLDCLLLEQMAKSEFQNWDSPYVVGVGIGPDLRSGGGYTNYFKYHGAVSGNKVAVGVSFGRSVKAVVVSDGYYPAVAHEVAHTFGLYRGVPEQYTQYNPGAPANGYFVENNEWRSGYDFMGLSTYKSTATTWTSTSTTFNPLFAEFKTTADPQLILVSGAIMSDGSLDTPYDWIKLPYGVPDTVPTGDYAIKFTLIGGGTTEISFDAQFTMHLDPGIEMGEDLPSDFTGFGDIPIGFAPFAFAAVYPANTDPTHVIEVVDKTLPPGEQIIGVIPAERVVTVSEGALSEGFGGFVSPIKEGASFKKGTAVPVKFQLKTPQGAYITTAQPALFLSFQGRGPEIPATSLPPVQGGNLFRYDYAKNQYIFNLDTRNLSKGTWQLRVFLGDGTVKTVNVIIR